MTSTTLLSSHGGCKDPLEPVLSSQADQCDRGGTFGSAPSTIGAGVILETFFLHQRGRGTVSHQMKVRSQLISLAAFACYAIATLFGTQFGGTFSGYITATAPWTVQLWWTVGALGLCCILVFFFLEDTTYDRYNPGTKPVKQSYIQDRIATFFPGHKVVQQSGEKHGVFDPFIIGVQPVTILAGSFLLITFAWAVAVTTLLRYVDRYAPSQGPSWLTVGSVFLQEPVKAGGYGFGPLANANVTLAQWVGIVIAEMYNMLFGDRLPLWRCRRNGGIWKPEFRLYPLLVPNLILLPAALGIFGSALQYHLHYMVIAFAIALLNVVEISLVPVIFNYVCESFTSYPQEVATALNFYRLILGLTVTFYIDPWVVAVGPGWAFGMSTSYCFAETLQGHRADSLQWHSSPSSAFRSPLSWRGRARRYASGPWRGFNSRKMAIRCIPSRVFLLREREALQQLDASPNRTTAFVLRLVATVEIIISTQVPRIHAQQAA
jgi:hypothetical protein